MRRAATALAAGILLGGCVSTKRHNAVLAKLGQQSAQCVDHARNLTAAHKGVMERNQMLEMLLNTQLVNNEEILEAARQGKLERARKIREEVLRRNEGLKDQPAAAAPVVAP